MTKQHHIIYVPGLDDNRNGYELLVGWWHIYGIIPHVYKMEWKDEEKHFAPKMKKLLEKVNKLLDDGHTVSLVGGSAGGSAVLNTFLEQPKINAVVNVCGRLRKGINAHPSLDWAARHSPAFKESVESFEKREPLMTIEQRNRILTLTPMFDEIVPKNTTILKGAKNKTIFSVEHALSGLLGVTLFSPTIMSFLKEKANN
jgi:hypothetical protein